MLEYIVFVLDAFIALLGLVSSVGWRLDTPKPSFHCVPAPDEHPRVGHRVLQDQYKQTQ